MTRVYDPVEHGRRYDYLREARKPDGTTDNTGTRVEAVQRWAGGQPKDSWCMEWVWFIYDACYKGQCPFDREQSTEAFRQLAVKNGWVVITPTPGDIVLSLRSDGTAHHVGIVTNASPLTSIAGNTSKDGTSSNGDGVYEHTISSDQKLYVHIP